MKWNNIISTLKKIGRELVIMDQTDTYVLMTLKRFNELVDQEKDVRHLSEDELIKQINRQVADWRASQEDITASTNSENTLKIDKTNNDDDTFYIEPVE
jgi:hypothetical protein